MSRIKILPPHVRDKIAAGEVIVRPASVVKELIENSLDAQAQRIEIEIEDGGKRKCLINDDGVGMNREDALLALERYGTSKIESVDDIEHIITYGFRGEALASITQIAQFELETSDGSQGTKIEGTAGTINGVNDSQRPRGTKIKISNIFFNLPARRKFLKSAEWERRLIVELIKTYAMITPHVTFILNDSERSIVNLFAVDSMENRLKMVLPKNIADALTYVERNMGSVQISGFFSRPDFFERHHFNYIYVNSRPVKYPRIYRTIIGAYQNPKNMPAFLVNIQVDPTCVDVNIHPTKSEVKFKDERYILDLLTQIIKKEVFRTTATVYYETKQNDLSTQQKRPGATYPPGSFVQEHIVPYTQEETKMDTGEFWQLHNTYILAQTKSGLIIVDQHVAHERIIYESIMKGKQDGQRLLFPITLELTPEEYRAYKNTKPILKQFGVEFKEFSARTIVIDSLPTYTQVNREEIVGLFNEINGLGNLMKQKSELAKVLACRSAIKAGQKLSPGEMQDLIDKLFACENPYTCPHGRPIILKFSLEDLGVRFGRE
ncbi:hypothetical protein AMJ52_08465 [candidate division TA06 bacterium DG_78]|uniref:DNA mismatch repair protein MutL n=1 Tax=candidate division TA06 bacterium DG_78 TaxID=1703772 RepID=A0A0S7YA98_UNCT6|nr:MAG: hypothetical protein AMJ52_08465 [candidate division TA06 bacterium DG_78]